MHLGKVVEIPSSIILGDLKTTRHHNEKFDADLGKALTCPHKITVNLIQIYLYSEGISYILITTFLIHPKILNLWYATWTNLITSN